MPVFEPVTTRRPGKVFILVQPSFCPTWPPAYPWRPCLPSWPAFYSSGTGLFLFCTVHFFHIMEFSRSFTNLSKKIYYSIKCSKKMNSTFRRNYSETCVYFWYIRSFIVHLSYKKKELCLPVCLFDKKNSATIAIESFWFSFRVISTFYSYHDFLFFLLWRVGGIVTLSLTPRKTFKR